LTKLKGGSAFGTAGVIDLEYPGLVRRGANTVRRGGDWASSVLSILAPVAARFLSPPQLTVIGIQSPHERLGARLPHLSGPQYTAQSAEARKKDQTMMIERTTFGTITVDGKTYEHDVVIRLSGEVVKRKKKLSKKYYGTSHTLSKDEAKFVFEKGCKQLILGSGQMGNLHLSPEAEAFFAKKGCKVVLRPTPEAIRVFNKSRGRKAGLFHVTC
jgi:hypothetical protein